MADDEIARGILELLPIFRTPTTAAARPEGTRRAGETSWHKV
jgi:hypothetical protein